MKKEYRIAVAGTGYVGLSIAAPTNVYSTNRIDVALPKRTCFAHYIGH